MSLIDSFEKSGNFLFKYRGHFPLILFILAVPVAFYTPYELYSSYPYFEDSILVFSLLLIFSGHIVRMLTVGRRYMQSSGRNRSHQVAQELNTTGIYSIVRHPLYLGNGLIWFGLVCFLENSWFALTFIFIFWVYYERIMFAEERFLERKFGEKFNKWAAHVPTFFPDFRKFKASSTSFSWRIVFKNEYAGWISTMTTLLFLVILKRTAATNVFQFTNSDYYFALFILLFGLTFKGIKKYTNLFNPMD